MVRNRTSHRWVYTYTPDKWWQKMKHANEDFWKEWENENQ